MHQVRKKLYRSHSIIDSDMDCQFSLSEGESGDSDSSLPAEPAIVTVPSKQQKKPTRRAISPNVTDAAPDIPAIKIEYFTTVFSAAEMKQPQSKRTGKTGSFRLWTDEPWDTLKAQLLVKITDALNPKVIDFSQYSVTIGISRVIAKPSIALTSEADYNVFLKRIKHIKNNEISAQVAITESKSSDNKENTPEKDSEASKKKTKDLLSLPGNAQKITNMQALMVCWKCLKRQQNCFGMHCYVFEDGAHLALGNEAMESWAFAMMKGEVYATLKTPPNNHHFDPQNALLNPILRKHAENARVLQAANAAAAPVINVSFGREFTNMLCGQPNVPPLANPNCDIPPPLYTAPPTIQDSYNLNCPMLLQANRKPGPDMPLDAFCQQYKLDNGIRDLFKENQYKFAWMLRFLTVRDLEGMLFKAGEIAEVRDAIDRWSIPVT